MQPDFTIDLSNFYDELPSHSCVWEIPDIDSHQFTGTMALKLPDKEVIVPYTIHSPTEVRWTPEVSDGWVVKHGVTSDT